MITAKDPVLLASLKKHEGWRPYAYQDSVGAWTIGFGTMIDRKYGGGITEEEGEMLLINRLEGAVSAARFLVKNFDSLSMNRQRVLAEMVYNLGQAKFSKFKNTIAAIEAGDFDKAAHGMLNSLWSKQVGQRAITLAQIMKQG